MTRKLEPVSPGEMLAEEFLQPLGMSNYRLAEEIGVPALFCSVGTVEDPQTRLDATIRHAV